MLQSFFGGCKTGEVSQILLRRGELSGYDKTALKLDSRLTNPTQ